MLCSIKHAENVVGHIAEDGECHKCSKKEGRKKIFDLSTHSTHFIFGYMASDI